MIEVTDLSLKFRNSHKKIWSIRDLIRDLRDKNHEEKYINVLKKINLTIGEGEIVGVIGRNGSGKSTLLKVIAGMYHPDEGSVFVKGSKAILDLNRAFFPELNGHENVIVTGMMMGFNKWEIQNKIKKIKEFSELGDFFSRPVKIYSNGMISRLGLSLAAIMQVEVLLIDETLSVGDFFFQEKSKKIFTEIMCGSKCELIVSHDMELIKEHCTRALILHEGHIVFDGSPSAAVSQYTQGKWN